MKKLIEYCEVPRICPTGVQVTLELDSAVAYTVLFDPFAIPIVNRLPAADGVSENVDVDVRAFGFRPPTAVHVTGAHPAPYRADSSTTPGAGPVGQGHLDAERPPVRQRGQRVTRADDDPVGGQRGVPVRVGVEAHRGVGDRA